MKNKDQRHKYNSKLKGSGTMAAKSWLCVLCLTFLPLRLLTSLMGTASANSTVELGRESVPSGLVVAGYPNSSPQRQLWRADISLANDRRDEKSKGELMRMIEQVRSIRFMPRKHVPEFVVVPVEARANGTSAVEVELLTPLGEVLGEPVRLTSRVNALTGLGQVLTGGLILVLLTWWFTHWRSRRRAALGGGAERHPSGTGSIAQP